MNKLHDALKNEELMLEVGRKATEEQLNEIEIAGVKLKTGKTLECDTPQCKEYVRLAQQSTVEERLSSLLHEFQREFNQKDIKFDGPGPLERRAIKNRYVEEIKSELQLSEQKAREDLKKVIIEKGIDLIDIDQDINLT